MEFNEKLQKLRKQKALTQEQLAQQLFVSRTAISKWESGRGYPSIDSLKAIAAFFGLTIDELLSGEELLSLAEENSRQKEQSFRDLVFALLDCSVLLFLFLPFFRQNAEGMVQAVSLLSLTETAVYLKGAYWLLILGSVGAGILTLALQNNHRTFWGQHRNLISMGINGLAVLLFIISLQPYAAALLFVFLTIKALILAKKQ